MIYVESSALVKLVVSERETPALRGLLREETLQTASVLVEIEVLRAVRREAPQLFARAEEVLAPIAVVGVTDAIRARAALLDPAVLRSLDAIHLATALEIRDELDGLVTYDQRMATAARDLGIPVLAPV